METRRREEEEEERKNPVERQNLFCCARVKKKIIQRVAWLLAFVSSLGFRVCRVYRHFFCAVLLAAQFRSPSSLVVVARHRRSHVCAHTAQDRNHDTIWVMKKKNVEMCEKKNWRWEKEERKSVNIDSLPHNCENCSVFTAIFKRSIFLCNVKREEKKILTTTHRVWALYHERKRVEPSPTKLQCCRRRERNFNQKKKKVREILLMETFLSFTTPHHVSQLTNQWCCRFFDGEWNEARVNVEGSRNVCRVRRVTRWWKKKKENRKLCVKNVGEGLVEIDWLSVSEVDKTM